MEERFSKIGVNVEWTASILEKDGQRLQMAESCMLGHLEMLARFLQTDKDNMEFYVRMIFILEKRL